METNGARKYCKHCGQLIDKDCIFCPICGKQVEDLPNRQQPQQIYTNDTNANSTADINASSEIPVQKSKTAALLLCLFCGFFGIHRFYVGKIGTGILWLLTGGFLGVGCFIDLILIIVGSFRDNLGRELI